MYLAVMGMAVVFGLVELADPPPAVIGYQNVLAIFWVRDKI